MGMPTNNDILASLDRLETQTADDLESEFLEFKPWLPNVKDNMTVALEIAVCFAKACGWRDSVWRQRSHPRTSGRDYRVREVLAAGVASASL